MTRERTPGNDDLNLPYENIAEGADDLSSNWAKIQAFANDFNTSGYAYRGATQNSNTFINPALKAGNLPEATGVATDPIDVPGNLYEFLTPGLNDPLKSPVGPDLGLSSC